jgi:site-specific recombinase XerC
VAKSARIASPAYYNFALAVTNNTASYLSATQAKFAARCIQKRFLAAGYKTQADVEKAAHSQKVRDILTTCFLKGRDH